MKLQSVFVLLVSGLALADCSSNSGPSSATGGNGAGGVTGAGGGGSGGPGACSAVTACGGHVAGTWTVSSSCLAVTGQLDLSAIGAPCSPTVTGSLQVSGTWTANADKTTNDATMTTGQVQFTLPASCQVISSTHVDCDGMGSSIQGAVGYSSVTCTGTVGCACTATVNQQGGLGIVASSPSQMSNYTEDGNVLTVSGDAGDAKYGYCVSGDTLTVSPQSAVPAVTGTIVLTKSAATGAGGAGATAGAAGTSGTAGSGTAGSGGTSGTAGTTGTGGSSGTAGSGTAGSGTAGSGTAGSAGSAGASGNMGPCDIYKAGGTPCVAAHSTTRALLAGYGGKLYQVRNSAMATKDINAVAPGGAADGAAQDTFCTGTTCVITIIYDQSGHGNDVTYEGPGSPVGGVSPMHAPTATKDAITIGGKRAYGVFMDQNVAFWADGSKSGMPLNAEPQGIYMVATGVYKGGGHTGKTCCFDYGNGETGRKYVPGPSMDALNFSTIPTWQEGAGSGPWVMADLEGGIYSSGTNSMKVNPNVPSMPYRFVTAVEKNNGTTEFALRGSDATKGSLATFYKGKLPSGYNPMKKQGAIVVGSGGDCCQTNNNLGSGTFYEGAIVAGYPSDATEDAIQASILAAQYGQ